MPRSIPQLQRRRRRLLAVLPALVASIAVCASASAASSPVTLSPAAGTPDASPETQISVLGPKPSSIVSVTATGASTGAHAGRLRAYSGGRGASFLPAKPFAQGETVKVVVKIKGQSPLRSSFTVARAGVTPPILNLSVTQPDKLEHFVTQPDLQAPLITVLRGQASSGNSVFLTPLPSPIIHPESNNAISISPVGPGGPMIVDAHGKLVWFRQLTHPDVAANLRVQTYRGKRVLTWWQGPVTSAAFGLGEAIIADSSYRTIDTVKTGNGYKMDIHEFTLTPDGDALATVYSPVLVHLDGTPAGTLSPVLDSIIQEIDVRTGLVVWEWHALGHIPLSQSYATPANSSTYDAFHINSIQALADGTLLVGARDTSAVYKVDRATGRILWTLGGKKSTFKMGKGVRFWFQHDAQMLPGNRVSLFDDEAGPPQKAPASRALVIGLDMKKHTAKVVRQATRVPDTSAQSEGSVQSLANGGLFVGFGAAGPFTEFSKTGKMVFDAKLPDGDGSYRNYSLPWSATPRTKPVAAAQRIDAGHVAVYASWNGATAVARWQVLAGGGAGTPAASAARSGFETRIATTSTATTFAVRALSASGKVLATSAAVTVQ